MLTVRGGVWRGLCRSVRPFSVLMYVSFGLGIWTDGRFVVIGLHEVERVGSGELSSSWFLHLAMEFGV